ncbi:MAG: hypothetical protein ABI835_02140 [Chloroflexota bacterium]
MDGERFRYRVGEELLTKLADDFGAERAFEKVETVNLIPGGCCSGGYFNPKGRSRLNCELG